MRIVIPGGTGQVGTFLARALHEAGNDVVVLTRKTTPGQSAWRQVHWNGREDGLWRTEIDGAGAVINLAGRSVDCRYNKANRRVILDSRIQSTRILGAVIAACAQPPRVWLQASTATIYEHRYDSANDEATGILAPNSATPNPPHPDTWQFSVDIAEAWEGELAKADTPYTRKIAMRMAMVMGTGIGGVFDVLLKLVRRRLGGRIGDGRQFVSWIHEHDFARAIEFLINEERIEGSVNLCAPEPLPQTQFMAEMRRAAGVRLGLPATKWMLEIATFLMRTESELILKSRRVAPGRLLDHGFAFEYPNWAAACAELVARRARRPPQARV